MKLFILGINGFIGANLVRNILKNKDWKITGFDITDSNISDITNHSNFTFIQGDIFKQREVIRNNIKNADIVLPLVAIANPLLYVQRPLDVFKLDFEENLKIVYDCIEFNKRIIFPSTSEVYGMSTDIPSDEQTSNLTTGPICKERWIYSTSKQLMDRIIYASGKHENLPFTIFRPFNFIGQYQDNPFNNSKQNRAIPTFISNILYGKDITLVDGGSQKRCFIYINDAIEALIKIIENNNNCADNQIFNIGYTEKEYSIKQIVDIVISSTEKVIGYENVRQKINIINEDSKDYYGDGYQDVKRRVPNIENTKQALNWEPTTSIEQAIQTTVNFYLNDMARRIGHKPFNNSI